MDGGALEGPVAEGLARLVAEGALTPDARQHEAARLLNSIADGLAREATEKGLSRFLPAGGRRLPVRGAYIYGEVGRGKTMLMDLFFAQTSIAAKRRVHFHEFMDEIHDGIAKFRASPKGRHENADPIAAVVKPILKSVRLLCLDEFQVSDITNAMVLGRLFERLFAGGVTLVATSNTPPDALYADGLNRQLFLPFIELLKQQVTVFSLAGETDYRRLKFEGEEVFHFAGEAQMAEKMEALWLKLTGGLPGEADSIEVLGRSIKIPLAAMGAARFAATDLLDKPLGARDYLKLAQHYDSLMIEHIPQFERVNSSAAKRFILLVDTLYDRGVKLAASFDVPLDQLAMDKRTRAEFARARSRLAEMASAQYLAAPHKEGKSPAGGIGVNATKGPLAPSNP